MVAGAAILTLARAERQRPVSQVPTRVLEKSLLATCPLVAGMDGGGDGSFISSHCGGSSG